jgi:hypothetical protein
VVGRESDSKPRMWCPHCGTLIESDTLAHVPTKFDARLRAERLLESSIAILGPGVHQGLMLVAADAVFRANKAICRVAEFSARQWDIDMWPKLVAAAQESLEGLSEAMAAVIEEVDAQGEDLAEVTVWAGDQHADKDPERLRDLLRRTLRRRRAKQ